MNAAETITAAIEKLEERRSRLDPRGDVVTPRWKIRRVGDNWLVWKKQAVFRGGWQIAYVIDAEYRLWENAIAHTEIR